MSLRVLGGLLFIAGFSIYAWRNYFTSLCALLVFTAFFKHPDMPRSAMGIPGLEFWNVLLVNVALSWLAHRRREGLEWDFPPALKLAVKFYLAVLFIAFLRMFIDPTDYYTYTRKEILLDYIVSPVKFLIPAVILYDSARTRERATWAMAAIMMGYFFLSLQVVKYMGLHVYSGDELNKRGAKIIQHAVGYDRVDVAMMLAGSAWGMIALSRIAKTKWYWLMAWGGAAFILMAETLTGGRSGYAACGLVGLMLCLIRWRKYLPLIPLAGLVVVIAFPGVRERMLHGFDKESGNIVVEENNNEITSGRTVIWPYVIKKIEASPIIGYGRDAMVRTGLHSWLMAVVGEEFGHPHNAYLEILLDDGIIGFLCVIPLYLITLKRSLSVFREKSDPIYEAAGGIACALLFALLVTGMGAQTLYPREDVIWMWGAVAIAMRLWVQREAAKETSEEEVTEESEYVEGTAAGVSAA